MTEKRDSALAVGGGWADPPSSQPTIDEALDELTADAPDELLHCWLTIHEPDPDDPDDFLKQTTRTTPVDLVPRRLLRSFAHASRDMRSLGSFIRGPVAAGGLNLGFVAPPDTQEAKRRADYDKERAQVGYPPIKRATPSCSTRTWFRMTEITRRLVDWREAKQ